MSAMTDPNTTVRAEFEAGHRDATLSQSDTKLLAELAPLTRVIDTVLHETPVRLGDPASVGDLSAALTVRVAAWCGRTVLPAGAPGAPGEQPTAWPPEIQDCYRKRALQWGAAEVLVTAARERGETELDIDEIAKALGLDDEEAAPDPEAPPIACTEPTRSHQ
ncbi:hypothetical protein ABZZ79_02960 [Streptomyces sp. NPDC006458]|uniref:hypothetical protein n=1 Tax=Streptomyces sp. NPDC006458 TaxID=3154302 RepID=UPI0033B18601